MISHAVRFCLLVFELYAISGKIWREFLFTGLFISIFVFSGEQARFRFFESVLAGGFFSSCLVVYTTFAICRYLASPALYHFFDGRSSRTPFVLAVPAVSTAICFFAWLVCTAAAVFYHGLSYEKDLLIYFIRAVFFTGAALFSLASTVFLFSPIMVEERYSLAGVILSLPAIFCPGEKFFLILPPAGYCLREMSGPLAGSSAAGQILVLLWGAVYSAAALMISVRVFRRKDIEFEK